MMMMYRNITQWLSHCDRQRFCAHVTQHKEHLGRNLEDRLLLACSLEVWSFVYVYVRISFVGQTSPYIDF